MLQIKRKKMVILSFVIILVILSIVTVYSYLSSNYILERASGEKIDFTTYAESRWDIWGIKGIEEDYILFDNYDDWVNFINRSYRIFYEDYIDFNESQIDVLVEQQGRNLNFTKFVYFGAFFGSKPNTGYLIEIKDVILEDNQLKLFILKSEPKPWQYTGQAITHPHHVISMERKDIPINANITLRFLTEDDDYLLFIDLMIVVLIMLTIFIMIDRRSKKANEKNQN
jgi:hypothetical protein